MAEVLFLVHDGAYFLRDYLPLARRLLDEGFSVAAAVPADPETEGRLVAERIRPVHADFLAASNATAVLCGVGAAHRLLRDERPALVHCVSMRSVLIGGLAARLPASFPVVFLVTGLGNLFLAPRPVRRRLGELALRIALRRPRSRAIFQNEADRSFFLRRGIVSLEAARLIPGTGVDLDRFRPTPLPDGEPLILFPGRMIREKGVLELLDACSELRRRGHRFRLVLAGAPHPGNPSSLSVEELERLSQRDGYEWVGWQPDIRPWLARAHIVCLPSWREGLSVALLEAAAAGRPVVTTDVPGCRDAIVHGRTGLKVPPRDHGALAAALETLMRDEELRCSMGEAGRRHAEREFGRERILDQTLDVYRELL
ncbi:MAG: glycosyltransferase family 4 protein [Myxococcota bacterium]